VTDRADQPAPPIFRSGLLEGRTALITGGGTGIGFGIATELARYGADLCLASRNPDHLRDAAAQLETFGRTVTTVELNVRDPEAVQQAFRHAADTLGHIDLLVNNAAGNFYAPSETLSPNAWRAVVETDLYGTFYCAQAAYPYMIKQGGGRIVSISMTLHYRGWPLMAHATAAKAGVDALTRTLAVEWAPHGITVNAIAPGPILTEGVRKAFVRPDGREADTVSLDERLAAQIPLKRLGTPADIGNMVTYLASPAGAWITGAIMVVDGGSWLARV